MAIRITSARNTTSANAKDAATEAEIQAWLELIVPILADKFIVKHLTGQGDSKGTQPD